MRHPAPSRRPPSHDQHRPSPRRGPARDGLRQALNLAGAAGQILATVYVVARGTVDYFDEPTAGVDPPIIPAGYAFSIWGPIYAGSLAYAIYQALPAQRARPLLRRLGFPTALAFGATTAWLLVAQRPERVWGTVALILVITGGLAAAFRELVRHRRAGGAPFARGERYLVVAPLSVFLGWCSVATFANAFSALRATGLTAPGGAEPALAALAIAAAAGGAAWATVASRGNAWYALTVVWALTAIVAANAGRPPVRPPERPRNPMVAAVAGAAAGAVLGALAYGRRKRRAERGE